MGHRDNAHFFVNSGDIIRVIRGTAYQIAGLNLGVFERQTEEPFGSVNAVFTASASFSTV